MVGSTIESSTGKQISVCLTYAELIRELRLYVDRVGVTVDEIAYVGLILLIWVIVVTLIFQVHIAVTVGITNIHLRREILDNTIAQVESTHNVEGAVFAHSVERGKWRVPFAVAWDIVCVAILIKHRSVRSGVVIVVE